MQNDATTSDDKAVGQVICTMLPQRLSNLSQTDIGPLLPLPVLREPTDASSAFDGLTSPPNYQPAVLQYVLALLQSCDTTYM